MRAPERDPQNAAMDRTSADNMVVIERSRGWRALGLHEVWQHRELLYFLTWREIKSRYRQMAIGPLWVLIAPLANMVLFSVIFGAWAGLPSEGLPHPVFYFAALLPWQVFSGVARSSATSLVSNMNLIAKVYFPRLIVPLSTCATGLVDFLFAFVVLAGMMAWYGIAPGIAALALPFYLFLAMAAALAIGLWLAAVAVRFRDVAYGMNLLMQIWMFATIIYPSAQVPERWRTLYRLNPMQAVVEGFRWGLLGRGQAPDAMHAATSLIVIAALIGGAYVFRRTEREIVDLM